MMLRLPASTHILPLGLLLAAHPHASGAPQEERTESAAAAVAAARRALGWDTLAASKHAVRVEGSARFLGTDAVQTLLFDGTGRFVETFDGPLPQSDGLDGSTAWVRDWSDTPRVLVLGDLASAQLSALFLTGSWTVSEELLRFELAPAHGEEELTLAFTHADGVQTGTIQLDPRTHRARSVSFGSDSTPTTWTFADYEEHDGFAFPRRIELTQSGITQALDTRTVTRLAEVEDGVFAPRLAPPRDARFDPERPAGLEVKRARTGHLLVHPSVDGQDLGWFIFDSGAGTNCISNGVAESLAEGPFGEIGARGIGGTVPASFWRAEELRLGPLVLEAPIFLGLDLAFLEPHFGVPVGGILGFELLSRCVVELDMDAAAISLHDPRSYALPEPGRWEEVLVYGRHPCVRASFEGREGLFKLDTGAANDTVTLHYQVVRDLDLTAGRETSAGTAGGVGGSVGTRIGELASFRLGGHEFSAIQAGFTLEDKGAFSDDYVWGNVGGKLLEPFRLVFDYPGGRVGFVPRAR